MSGGYNSVLLGLLVTASITDLIWGKVYNLITIPLLLVGLIYRFWDGGTSAAMQSGLAVLVAFTSLIPFYLTRVLAAGDVKLLMAVGAWTSWETVIHLEIIGVIIGAAVGVYLLLRHRGLLLAAKGVAQQFRSKKPEDLKATKMPFAPAFLCAYIFVQIAEVYQWPLL